MLRTDVDLKPERLVIGAVLTTLSFLCVSVMSAMGKVAGQLTSTGVVVLFQNLIAIMFIAPIALRGGWAMLQTDKIGLHILRAATGTACWYALFVAITMMPLTNAILLSFSAPLWMPVIAWLVTRERASTATWFGAALGFVGVVLVLQPHHHHFNVGTLFALAGAVLLAVALMSVRWLGATEPMPRILFYYFLLSTVMAIPIAALQWHSVAGTGLDLLARHRIRATLRADLHRARLPLRVVGQARPVHLHDDRLHGIDRLGRLASSADAVRHRGHGPGDRRRTGRDQ